MDYQTIYKDNVNVDGIFKTQQINVATNGGQGNGSISGQSLTITNGITSSTVAASGAVSGSSFATTGNTAVSGEIKATTITASGIVSGSTVNATTVNGTTINATTLTAPTVKADVIGVDTGSTTLINAPKIPTSLSIGITSGAYVPVTDTNGVMKLLQAPSTAGQYLSSDGTGAVVWQNISGTINNWAILNEQYTNGNNATYYDGTLIQVANNIAITPTSYTRVFTSITESVAGSIITGKTSVSYTNASPNSICYTDFTLGPGKYLFIGSFPSGTTPGILNSAYVKHYAKVESADGSFATVQGTQELATAVTRTLINTMVTLTTSTKMYIKHYTSFVTLGGITAHLGTPSGSGTPFYGTLLIIKIT